MAQLATTTTAEQAAEEYARLVREGSALLDEADALMIRAALEEMATGIRQRITEQEARITAAEPELASAQAELDRLRAELAECQRRAGNIQAAAADDDLTIRIEARVLKLAVAEEVAELTARVQDAEAAVSGHDAAIGQAASRVQEHEAELRELAAAASDPFTHPLGQQTKGYTNRIVSGRTMHLLAAGAVTHPEYDAAFRYMTALVRLTGFGADVERRVEAGVRDEYSTVHNLDGIPWTGRTLTAQQAASHLQPLPRLPSAQEEAANGLPFERQQGIPGVKPSDAARA